MRKQEILNGISEIQIDCSDFDQAFEGDEYSSAFCKKAIETENYNIEIELMETVRWTAYDENELDSLEISELSITDLRGKEYEDKFTDDEILNIINY